MKLSDVDQIEEVVLGSKRPRSFEERYPSSGVIGEGGMGKVHLAQDRILMRDVAIKELRGEERPDPVVLRRFLREAQVTAQLNHPNVVPLYGLESTGRGSPVFVMKLIEGITFKEYVETCRQSWGSTRWDHDTHGLKTRIEHFVKACDAVAYGHERGVIHRDLKPANVMLGDHNVVYVMDWGIARVVGETTGDEFPAGEKLSEADLPDTGTRTGDVIGTPMFMSPEQATLESRKLTPASDQYSLGLMLQTLVTCRPPRDAGNVVEAILMARAGEHAPFSTEGPGAEAPPELRAIIQKATRQDPDLRYPSVGALAADLRRFLHGEEVHALPDSFVRAAWRRIDAHPVKAMSALLAVVLVAASTSIWNLRSSIEHKAESLAHLARVDHLLGAMTMHLERIDRNLAGSEMIVKTLAVRVEEALARDPVSEPHWFGPADLHGPDAPPDTALLERYGQLVSFACPVNVLAPDVERVDVKGILSHHRELGDALQEIFVQALPRVYRDGEDPTWWSRERTLAILREESTVRYAYLGFEQGLLVNYPAVDRFPDDYDPRLRPWYRQAKDTVAPTWGAPYPDASGSGLLLPCSVTIRDRRRGVLGVAGLDISVKQARDALGVKIEEDEVRDAYLVDGEGRILFSVNDVEVRPVAGLNDNRPVELRPLGVAEVEAKIREGTALGSHQEDETLYVYARLRTLDWTLVLVLDAKFELR